MRAFFLPKDNEVSSLTLTKAVSCINTEISLYNKGLGMRHHYIPEVSVNVTSKISKQPRFRARKRPLDSLNFTFQKLKHYMQSRLATNSGPSLASGPNVLSAFNTFMGERGYTDNDVVGSILRASYRRNVAAHIETLKAQGRPPAYISNRKYLLTHWRRALLEADQASAAHIGRESPFQTALQELFATGATMKGTCRASGLPLPTLKRWLAGRVPNGRSLPWVPRLENHFGIPAGTLSDLLPYRLSAKRSEIAVSTPIAYRERLRTQHVERYAIKEPNEQLRSEWRALVAYKVARGKVRVGGLRRAKSGRWSTASAPVKPRSAANWYAFHGSQYVATADIQWGMTSQYLGWLMLEEARGGKALSAEAAMTLANFARDDLLNDYHDWRLAKSGVKLAHAGTLRFLKVVCSLCNGETGYLTQKWDEFAAVARATNPQMWLDDCASAFEFASSTHDDSEGDAEPSRRSFEPIASVLALSNPLEAVADAVIRMDANRPNTGGEDEAIWARDRLLFKLLASNPLRDKNTRMLTYHADGSGHLRKVDGVWRIAIPKGEFKNARGAARDRDYNMPVRPEVWPDIERYLRDYRPMLTLLTNPYVFVSSRRSNQPVAGLRRRFEVLTRRYLSGCLGVGPHAIRHIVATSILKQRPNDWAAAAWALHDHEATVRTHYSHLRSDDAQTWFDPAMSGPFARM